MSQTIAALRQKINQEIENGNYDEVEKLTQELCRLRGLDQIECGMPESFIFEVKRKGKEERKMKMKKQIAKAAAVIVILGVSGGTAVAATQHFRQAKHFDNGLASGSFEEMESVPADEDMLAELPVLPEEDTGSDMEVLSSEEGTKDTAWLKKTVSRVADERYASDDGVNWELDEPDVKEVTEYTYPDYCTACADTGIFNVLQKDFEPDGTAAYKITHFMDGGMSDVSDLTTAFRYGNGRVTIDQSFDPDAQPEDVSLVITSTEGVTNQREYVSENGDTFALCDDTETGETRTTTMVRFDHYTVILTFTGMSEQEIHEVLDAVSMTK